MNKHNVKLACGGAALGIGATVLIYKLAKRKTNKAKSVYAIGGVFATGGAIVLGAGIAGKRKERQFLLEDGRSKISLLSVPAGTLMYISPDETGRGGVNPIPKVKAERKSTFSLGEINGFSETGNLSWRSANDKVFFDACNAYNEKYGLSESDDGYMSPLLMKAWAMVESGSKKDAFETDPLQVNNEGDWVDEKPEICGLSKGQIMTPKVSARAALEWWRYKGYIHSASKKAGEWEVQWKGDWEAFRDYNGNTAKDKIVDGVLTEHRNWYADEVIRLYNASK